MTTWSSLRLCQAIELIRYPEVRGEDTTAVDHVGYGEAQGGRIVGVLDLSLEEAFVAHVSTAKGGGP